MGVSNNSAGGSDSDTQDEAETGGPTGGPELGGPQGQGSLKAGVIAGAAAGGGVGTGGFANSGATTSVIGGLSTSAVGGPNSVPPGQIGSFDWNNLLREKCLPNARLRSYLSLNSALFRRKSSARF